MHPNAPVLTDLDAARLKALGENAMSRFVDDEAAIVPRELIAPDVVTVHSTVSFRDVATDSVHRVTLVFPDAVSVSAGRISILSPVGRALLGRTVGARTAFTTPEGISRPLRVLAVHYQPEAAGDRAL